MTAADPQPPEPGSQIEPFTLETTRGPLRAPDPEGRCVVLLFYVEAGTPLCSAQIAAVEGDADTLTELGGVAVAVSADPAARQEQFARQLGCGRVALAADPEGELARRFGVYDAAQRRSRRAAFVIDGSGTLIHAAPWYSPANSGQFAAVFAAVAERAAAGGQDDGR